MPPRSPPLPMLVEVTKKLMSAACWAEAGAAENKATTASAPAACNFMRLLPKIDCRREASGRLEKRQAIDPPNELFGSRAHERQPSPSGEGGLGATPRAGVRGFDLSDRDASLHQSASRTASPGGRSGRHRRSNPLPPSNSPIALQHGTARRPFPSARLPYETRP